MKIRITRKFSEFINGVDLTRRSVGDIVEVPRREAEILLAEDWAVPVDTHPVNTSRQITATDRARRSGKPKSPQRGN